MKGLEDHVAVVTGASRGAGRGIALVLGEAGATVYLTGRSIKGGQQTEDRPETIDETADLIAGLGGVGIPVCCDHTIDEQVEAFFQRVREERGRIDILVNNAWGGYEMPVDFAPFWNIPLRQWDLMLQAGVRSHMVTACLAIHLMLPQKKGLVVNTTSPIRDKYIGNVFYDVSKTAINRMALGMAADLRDHGIAAVTLTPGWMRTERVLEGFKTDEDNWTTVAGLKRTESTEYIGRAILALATDPEVMEKSGQFLEVGNLAREYEFTDTDGRQPPPFEVPDFGTKEFDKLIEETRGIDES